MKSPQGQHMDNMMQPQPQSQQQGFMQALMQRLRPGGLLGNAMGQLGNRAYMEHVATSRAQGMDPMSPEQFMQMQQQGQPRRGLLGAGM
jgi:hypothetical protein